MPTVRAKKGGLMDIIGQKIVDYRKMSKKELNKESWSQGYVLVLEDGMKIYASGDEEGNNGGTFFFEDKSGKSFYIFPGEKK